jgi:nitroreductase
VVYVSFLELAGKRYSVRKFKQDPVEEEKILKILEAGRLAPSAVNYQPYHFIVVTDQEMKDRLSKAYPREWFKSAPAVIAVCGDRARSWVRSYDQKDHCDIDAAIATDHMALAAADLGLGSCWVCAFNPDLCHDILDLPENMEVIVLLPIGYPESEAPPKKRKDLKDLVSFNRYEPKE